MVWFHWVLPPTPVDSFPYKHGTSQGLHWAGQEKKRRNKLEEKQPIESSESLPHLIYPVLPWPPLSPLHQIHTLPETRWRTRTRRHSSWDRRIGKKNSTYEKKEKKLRRKKAASWTFPVSSLSHLFCSKQHREFPQIMARIKSNYKERN